MWKQGGRRNYSICRGRMEGALMQRKDALCEEARRKGKLRIEAGRKS